jgi:hypothetical protein
VKRGGLITSAFAIAVLAAGAGLLVHLRSQHSAAGGKMMSHARSEFTFTVHAPLAKAFPLFGAKGERVWAGPEWEPQFVYPTPARDVEGAVFRIQHSQHGHHDATWVNTAFDAKAGHAAYVYVVEGRLATRIDVQLMPIDTQMTSVHVVYERTGLDSSVDIGEMARKDSAMGPDWEKSIADYLARR